MNSKILRFTVVTILVCSLILVSFGSVSASPPPDGAPGLARSIEVKERHAEALLEVTGVAGVGVGHNKAGNPSVIIFTETPGVRGLPAFLDGVPVVTRVSGKFFAQPKPNKPDKPDKPGKPVEPDLTPTDWWPRAVPIGVSTGHPAITAGTIGARVTDGIDVYALSNNHVYANSNNATIGDDVLQPGTADGGGGTATNDTIGQLFKYVSINFTGGDNTVDAAIAKTTTLLLDNKTPPDGYGTPQSVTAEAAIGMKVIKYGRTTGLTKGKVSAINFTGYVWYDSEKALFVNQIIITPGTFSAGGDSGSLVVVDSKRTDDHHKAVGLLFAGSSRYTIANPIDLVLDAFNVTIDGIPSS